MSHPEVYHSCQNKQEHHLILETGSMTAEGAQTLATIILVQLKKFVNQYDNDFLTIIFLCYYLMQIT